MLLLLVGSPGMGGGGPGHRVALSHGLPGCFAGSVQMFQLGSAVAAWFRLFGARLVSASLSYFS